MRKVGMFLQGFIKGLLVMPLVPFLAGMCYASNWGVCEDGE